MGEVAGAPELCGGFAGSHADGARAHGGHARLPIAPTPVSAHRQCIGSARAPWRILFLGPSPGHASRELGGPRASACPKVCRFPTGRPAERVCAMRRPPGPLGPCAAPCCSSRHASASEARVPPARAPRLRRRAEASAATEMADRSANVGDSRILAVALGLWPVTRCLWLVARGPCRWLVANGRESYYVQISDTLISERAASKAKRRPTLGQHLGGQPW